MKSLTPRDTNNHRMLRLSQLAKHPRHMYRLQRMRRVDDKAKYTLHPFETTRSLFVHIPKASGVSIARALYGNLGGGHMPMRDYELAFGPQFFAESFVFTFVRNPWDRLHSAYRFLAKGGMNRADAAWADVNRAYLNDFEHFVERGLADPAVARSIHIVPQQSYLRSRAYGYRAIDFIGLYENIASDFDHVCRSIHGSVRPLPHENRTVGSAVDYRAAYTERMRDIVGAFYASDIACFGYDFEGSTTAQQIERRDAGTLISSVIGLG